MDIFARTVEFPCAASQFAFFDVDMITNMNATIAVKQNKMAPICEMSHEPSWSRPTMNVGMEIIAPIMKTTTGANL